MSEPDNDNISRWVGVGESCLAFNLRKADRYLTKLYDEALAPAGLRHTQFSLLATLQAMSPATMSSLAAQMGMDRTTLNRNFAVLEGEGWAESEAGEDLRERRLVVTAKGRLALSKAFPLWQRVQAKMARGIGKQQLAALLSELGKLGERPSRGD